MTEIDVHFNVADKAHHACRLLRKAVLGAGAQAIVVGESPLLAQLDAALWQLAPTDFLPHCTDDAPAHVQSRSPLLLVSRLDPGRLPHQQVLVNLGDALPAGFEGFERLIDVVGQEPEGRQAGRLRWRHYADRGYGITRHDMQAPA